MVCENVDAVRMNVDAKYGKCRKSLSCLFRLTTTTTAEKRSRSEMTATTMKRLDVLQLFYTILIEEQRVFGAKKGLKNMAGSAGSTANTLHGGQGPRLEASLPVLVSVLVVLASTYYSL